MTDSIEKRLDKLEEDIDRAQEVRGGLARRVEKIERYLKRLQETLSDSDDDNNP